jgi:hypothetical protein
MEYKFITVTFGLLPKIDHTLGYKASLNKYKTMEIISCTLSGKMKTRNQQQEKL